jgi:hypothetical protein
MWQIEKSFRMSRTELRARPIYRHNRDSIEADLTIVMADLAVSHWLERRLVDQEGRPDATPLPQHRGEDRRPHAARRHPARRRRTSRRQRHQDRSGWTLI